MAGVQLLLEGLSFGESLRWHQGRLWLADCVRVREGGDVLQTIHLDRGCFSCALGGADRTTLFMAATEWRGTEQMADGSRTGRLLTAQAPSAGAGWP